MEKFISFCLLVFVAVLFMTVPVWLLWNWLMPVIFGVKTITLLQAWGVSLLCALLFMQSSISSSKEDK